METYIALLRGINVGGKNKLLMKELKVALEALKLTNVTTYIQSGNIVFQYENMTPHEIEKAIESLILEQFQLSVQVIVIAHLELIRIEKENPFHLTDTPIEKKYGSFLKTLPESNRLERMIRFDIKNDEYHIDHQFIYLKYADRAGNSKLTNNLIENKLNVVATTRNWKTIQKLIEIGYEISE